MHTLTISGEEGESRVPQRLQDGEVIHQPRAERGGRLDDIAGHGKTGGQFVFQLNKRLLLAVLCCSFFIILIV